MFHKVVLDTSNLLFQALKSYNFLFIALHFATKMKHPKIVAFLLSQKNCEVNPIDIMDQRSPLFYAIENEDQESVELLFENNAVCK